MTENEAIEVLKKKYIHYSILSNIEDCKRNNQNCRMDNSMTKSVLKYWLRNSENDTGKRGTAWTGKFYLEGKELTEMAGHMEFQSSAVMEVGGYGTDFKMMGDLQKLYQKA